MFTLDANFGQQGIHPATPQYDLIGVSSSRF